MSTGTAEVVPDPDRPGAVTLHVNGVPSSYVDLDDPGFLAFEYMQQMAAVLATLPDGPLRAVHLGAAGCALARHVEHERPGSRQLGVDLDGRLLELVREWFALPRAPRLRLRAADAGEALATLPPGAADVVVRDVFAGDATPPHLAGAAAARAARAALRPGGVYLVNCADRPPLRTARAEVATLAAAFGPDAVTDGRLALVAEPGILKGRRYGNLVLVAVAPAPTPAPAPAPEPVPTADDAASGPDLTSGHDGRTTPTGAAGAPGADAPVPASPDLPDLPDLRDPALARALRSLPVPAQALTGPELERFVGGAAPLP